MSLALIYTRAAIGVDAPQVVVEAHISSGLPAFTLVGLPETTVKEARDRVRSAIINSGFTFPAQRITVNLAPADLPKEGGRYDLPIAMAILAASGQIPTDRLNKYEFVGELALTGELRNVQGAIPAAMAALDADRQLILSVKNQQEVGLINHGHSLVASHLQEISGYFHGSQTLEKAVISTPEAPNACALPCLRDIIGQQQAKRALEVAAAGGHNLLLLGPPGTGKTMLATRLLGLLPPLSEQEALESAAINSLISASTPWQKWRQRPFRAPHHTSSRYALIGGGTIPRPGEISLAHHGVLFLDELPEFGRSTLDSLREPLESGEIHLSRTRAKVTYPARFQLIAAMNPSPSGHYTGQHSRASPQQTLRYLSRLSGPLLDRFDLSLEVPLLPPGMLSNRELQGETSETVRARVRAARERQLIRCGKINALMSNQNVNQHCDINNNDAIWLEEIFNKLGLSVRAWQRLLKVARTLADLAGDKNIERHHLMEAISYRAVDRLFIHLERSQ
ncbi:magnesium chelatase family protein [Izhakiella capsodis]|uniref:Magnesium chelatase family protein n=1 Tax=Izhakiella capsodis TaxID=1367852 RepID=A0A1I4YRM5_9GAMM|nr:YifB family Mg chelatase-like AAA ATPase [Izhakiella capsodis]SFN40698.1 magnesium chelatase family protein [Izhakiella capsodis]